MDKLSEFKLIVKIMWLVKIAAASVAVALFVMILHSGGI
jgi:hypothetical protein